MGYQHLSTNPATQKSRVFIIDNVVFTYFELYEKVTADVHEAEVVDSKGCSSLIPDVPAPCSTTCEVKEEAVEQPQDQVEENEPELPTRPSRVSFTQGEKSEGES